MDASTGLIGLAFASKLASMMLYVVLGYVVTRLGVVKTEDSKPLSALSVWVFQPAIIFNAFQLQLTRERLHGFLAVVVYALVVIGVWILLTLLFKGVFHLTPVEQATLVYSNCGNLILPLVSMMLGDEYVFYGSGTLIAFHLFLWTHGISAVREERSIDIKKILKNSNVIAVLVGLVFLVFQLPVPEILDTTISGLAQLVGPVSMIIIGMALADTDLKTLFTMKRAYQISFGRLVVLPLLMLGLLYVSGFLRAHPEYAMVLMVPTMSLAAPPASTVAQLAIMYDKHPAEASAYNMLGAILCMLTLPLIIQLYQFIFL